MGLFLDLIHTALAGIGTVVAADVWPTMVLPAVFGLLLSQLTALIVVVASLSRRLRQASRHLRELARVVQRQTRVIQDYLEKSQKANLAQHHGYPLTENTEEQIPDQVQLADGQGDFEEQFKALREMILAEMSKTD